MALICFASIAEYCRQSTEWLLVKVVNDNQIGSSERVVAKIEKIKNVAREFVQGRQLSGDEEECRSQRSVQQDLNHRSEASIQEASMKANQEKVRREVVETELQEARHRLSMADERVTRSEKRQKEMEDRITIAEKTAKESEERAQELQIQVDQLNQQLLQQHQRVADALRRLEYSEIRAVEAESRLQEYQSRWLVTRNEIELTDNSLGVGAYAEVKVAKFRGSRVAAKCYHKILLSEHNLTKYHREIAIAASLRHPNLVQFIGASVEEELILITELMTTSLGDLLNKQTLSEVLITSIALDVVKALNYLHLMKPHPLIHRDICSGNVLLNPLPDNQWKAKVSDYGSVNLLHHLNTAHPGNPYYSAPESETLSLQSLKMDIYSFGVLLAEMLTNELPELKDRHRQILKISIEHYRFYDLILNCLHEDRDQRPTTQQLFTQLNEVFSS